ncbi:hypothetical protein WAK64_04610 [Bacillus spongiae]|uniref:Multidrug ABC transporter ATPase n=1 Tax=Bacillus spongiae TaxID=2683610 RepID=A0ABU8HB03_9BACI
MKKKTNLSDTEQYNGSMAKDFEEIKLLGKQMERLRTNEELKENHMMPDPVQYSEEDLF